MEQHLRIALWMAFFIGHLQAKSLNSPTAQIESQETHLCFKKSDLRLDHLHKVKCDPSVNFTSPSNVAEHCYAEAAKCFQHELQQMTNCTGQLFRIGQTAEALERGTKIPEGHVDSSDCQWEKAPFAKFVEDFKTFAEQVSSSPGNC